MGAGAVSLTEIILLTAISETSSTLSPLLSVVVTPKLPTSKSDLKEN